MKVLVSRAQPLAMRKIHEDGGGLGAARNGDAIPAGKKFPPPPPSGPCLSWQSCCPDRLPRSAAWTPASDVRAGDFQLAQAHALVAARPTAPVGARTCPIWLSTRSGRWGCGELPLLGTSLGLTPLVAVATPAPGKCWPAGSICGMPTARAQHQGAACSRTFFRRRAGRRACPPASEGSTPHAGETARPEMPGIIGAIMGETSDVCKSAGPNRVILRVCTNQRSVYHTRWGLVVTDSHHSDNPRGGR